MSSRTRARLSLGLTAMAGAVTDQGMPQQVPQTTLRGLGSCGRCHRARNVSGVSFPGALRLNVPPDTGAKFEQKYPPGGVIYPNKVPLLSSSYHRQLPEATGLAVAQKQQRRASTTRVAAVPRG